MRQWHKHLAAPPAMFTDVILDRRVATLEPVLVTQALKNTLGSMPLLTVPAEVFLHPLIDEASEPVQLRPLDLRRAPIAGRHRKPHDLLHACTAHAKMNSCRAFAHAATTRETDLSVKFHDQNIPALPVARKGQSGKVLLCPQRDYHATSVANFCTAVLNPCRFCPDPRRKSKSHFRPDRGAGQKLQLPCAQP